MYAVLHILNSYDSGILKHTYQHVAYNIYTTRIHIHTCMYICIIIHMSVWLCIIVTAYIPQLWIPPGIPK